MTKANDSYNSPEYQAMKKEIKAEYAGFSKEEMVEVMKEAKEATKGFKCE